MVSAEQILAHDPCKPKHYLAKLYPMTLRQCAFQTSRAGVNRSVKDRCWAIYMIAPAEVIEELNTKYNVHFPKSYLSSLYLIDKVGSRTKLIKELYHEILQHTK